MNVYQENPNIVELTIKDKTGAATRFVVGKTLDEVIAIIEPEAPFAGATTKKARKPRRTKAQMAEAEAPYDPAVEAPGKRDKAWA